MGTGCVVLHLCRARDAVESHEAATLVAVGRAIARLKGYHFAGPWESGRRYPDAVFFVPEETLVRAEADGLDVRCADDLFGGVVPHEFVRTKIITHDLVSPDAERPDGWSHAFTRRVRDVVLPGYSAFSDRDAREAARRLLAAGAVRAKMPRSAGGREQRTLRSMDDASRFLDRLAPEDLTRDGVVLESQLDRVTTLSVGHVTVGDTTITYHGQQYLTLDNTGREVYGGSDLTCVRGDWDVLDRLHAHPDTRRAVRQARTYDEAAAEYGVMASRRNYDVGQGVDPTGRPRSGVFEASWRVGGATAAEVAALEAFARDPSLDVVHASTVERYGVDASPPRDAIVHFHGVDKESGPVLRYTMVRMAARQAG